MNQSEARFMAMYRVCGANSGTWLRGLDSNQDLRVQSAAWLPITLPRNNLISEKIYQIFIVLKIPLFREI